MNSLRMLTIAIAAVVSLSLPARAADGLKLGEYACYGSGGTLLIGLGFKVLDASHYNDLDGKSPGNYAVAGDKVMFKGGHLDGETGIDLKAGRFNLSGHGISCEPFS